jgi:hypothetical protein
MRWEIITIAETFCRFFTKHNELLNVFIYHVLYLHIHTYTYTYVYIVVQVYVELKDKAEDLQN